MKPPRLLNDVYGDLRDRHLLPLVGVLLVATAALPFILGGSAEPVPQPSTDPTAALAAEEIPTLPAVLASNPGLRDYRKRLDAFHSKNPFAQDLDLPKPEVATVEGAGAPASSVVASGAEVPTSTSTSTSTSSTAPISTGSSSPSSTDTSTSSEGEPAPSGSTEIKKFLIRHEIDAEIDGPGDDRKFEGVDELDTLPGKKTPLVVYVGVTQDEQEAVFLLSKDVIKTDGDGTCRPARDDCQILTLGEGEQRKLMYSAHGGVAEKYILKLHHIERVIEPLK